MRPVAVALCVAAVAVVGCGGDRLDTGRAERKIESGIERTNRSLDVTVDCPSDVPREEGREFNCRIATREGDVVDASVRQVDDSGRVRYVVLSPPWRRCSAQVGVVKDVPPRRTEIPRCSNQRK